MNPCTLVHTTFIPVKYSVNNLPLTFSLRLSFITPGRTLMLDSSLAGEIMKRAQMILKTKGQDALKHANQVFDSMQKSGDEENRVYWHRIVKQVELLVEENGPG